MRAFSADRDSSPVAAGNNGGESPRRIVSLKKSRGGERGEGGEKRNREKKRAREDISSANGDAAEDESRKRGVRGRGAATYQSSVAAVEEGPRKEPPESDPSRVLKVGPNTCRRAGPTVVGPAHLQPVAASHCAHLSSLIFSLIPAICCVVCIMPHSFGLLLKPNASPGHYRHAF